MAQLTDKEFEGAIQAALDAMPDAFLDDLENVIIMAQDEPEDWQLETGDGLVSESGDLLGLYDGVNIYEPGQAVDVLLNPRDIMAYDAKEEA